MAKFLEAVINDENVIHNKSLSNISIFLSSNSVYKYTSTYLNDSENEYDLFMLNVKKLKIELFKVFNQYETALQGISLPLHCKYELLINNSVLLGSHAPYTLKVIDNNESKLLFFLNQKDFYKHHLKLRFCYSTEFQISDHDNYEYSLEHTFEIKKELDLSPNLDCFMNLLKLDLCAKNHSTNK